MLTIVNPDWTSWLGLYLGSTPESGLKTMIIIIFVQMLTWVNYSPHSWHGSCLGTTLESGFKVMIITTFIFMLIWVNLARNPGLYQLLELCLGSTLELGFKAMIITFFILVFFLVVDNFKIEIFLEWYFMNKNNNIFHLSILIIILLINLKKNQNINMLFTNLFFKY
jgi:hypothetical protein